MNDSRTLILSEGMNAAQSRQVLLLLPEIVSNPFPLKRPIMVTM